MRILEKILGRREATPAVLPPRVPLGVGVEDGGAWWPLEPPGHLFVIGHPARRTAGIPGATSVLHLLRERVERRLELLAREPGNVRDLDALNEARVARGEDALQSVTVRLDDVGGRTTLSSEPDDPLRRAFAEDMERIMRDGRAVGVYVSMQNWRRDGAAEEGGGR